jgi:flavodoxin
MALGSAPTPKDRQKTLFGFEEPQEAALKKLAVSAIFFMAALTLNAQENTQKILIAYFSRSGNTRAIAEYIHQAVGGDLFEIKTVQQYPGEYAPTTEVAKREQEANTRPELAAQVRNMNSYDVIFVGYPIWWGTMPMALFTFLESYNFAGKTIIPFCTHGSSGLGRSVNDIKRLCPQSTVRNSIAVRGGDVSRARGDVQDWLRGLGMTK